MGRPSSWRAYWREAAQGEPRCARGNLYCPHHHDHKTTGSLYSLRANDQPTAATPIKWSEVLSALKHRDAPCLTFTSAEVLKRVEKMGDLLKPVLTLRQTLPTLV